MIYTAVIIRKDGEILNRYASSSHNAIDAWNEISAIVKEDFEELLALIPGKHEMITQTGRLGYNV
tara:strand:+ start:1380 stop:1574 length:195 start_codon:yes stop_codon:yes gene_type:complete